MFKTIKQIHFIGIGGAGMSGVAEVLLNLGYKVSGSDLKKTEVTDRLDRLGAKIFYGHKGENVGEAQVVVTSTAVQSANPEVLYAKKNKAPVIARIEMLAELARLKYTIAIAGTHGKTTTTSMIAHILTDAGLDPTFIVGGKIHTLQSGAKMGNGEFLVAEADESDGSFLELSPTIALVTNIDDDHIDYYKTMKNLKSAFVEYANHVPFYGCAILCLDDPGVQSILSGLSRRVISYGLNKNADYKAFNIKAGANVARFSVLHRKKILGSLQLKLYGKHNVLNALSAVACALELGVPYKTIADSLKKFENVARRLEVRARKNETIWVDDYGHHPTEIKATILALKEKFPGKKISVLFQPHRYSRTKMLLKEFAESFKGTDELFLLPIYAAGEKPIPGISSEKLCAFLRKRRVDATFLNGNASIFLKNSLKPDHIFLTLGAGDVWKIGEKIFSD